MQLFLLLALISFKIWKSHREQEYKTCILPIKRCFIPFNCKIMLFSQTQIKNILLMKKKYLLLVLSIIFLNTSHAAVYQEGDVHTNLRIVSKNITEGIKSYNFEGLKYHARLAKKSIETTKSLLESTDCTATYDLSQSISTYLDTALLGDDLAAGRSYLYMAEELIDKTFYEYEVCTTVQDDVSETSSGSNNELSQLEQQQADLKRQQAELEQKANDLKRKLEEQKVKESILEKEVFMTQQDKTIAANIKGYNDLLKNCNCNATVSTTSEDKTTLTSKSIEELKSYYLDKIIRTTENYLQLLHSCK